MANQPRAWFRLRSTIGQPPAPAPRPEAQTAPPPPAVPLLRPAGFGRARTFRPTVAPPPQPPPGKTEPSPLPTPTPQASPSSSSSPSPSPSPPPSPPRAPAPPATSTSPPKPPAPQLPKAAASPPRPAATPPPAPTTTVTSPRVPQLTTRSPPSSPLGLFPTTTSHTVPTAPEQRPPPMPQPVSPPHNAAVPPAATSPPPQYARRSPNHVTMSTPTPSPPRAPLMTMKMRAAPPPSFPPPTSIKTPSPTHSTTPKAHVSPPSPLRLPPPQLQPAASNYKILDLPQQKTVLEDSSSMTIGNNNYNPQSRAVWHYKPSNGSDDKAQKPTGGLLVHKQATEVKPKDNVGNKKVEKKEKDKEEGVWSSTDSEDSGIRIITIAGENKGAVMEVGKYSSPTTWTSGSDVQQNGKGRKESSSSGGIVDHGLEGTSKKKGNKKCDTEGGAEKATRAFVNSNVQGVNNSIVYDSTISHDDPGVHLALTRMVDGYGRRGHGFYFKHHQHSGRDDDNLK